MTAVIDALVVSHPERRVFEDMRAGELSCVTVTCGVWPSTKEAFDSIGTWRDSVRANSDLVAIANSHQDIVDINGSGRTAILLGFQNTDQFEDRIRYVEIFSDLGVRVVQLTYNNQNAIGSSCYEKNDAGLSRFGHEVIEELNRVGMLVDLSHVGEKTSFDAIDASDQPVAITHANPATIFPHKRNKSDTLLRTLAEHGGVLGCALYPNVAGGPEMTIEQFTGMVAWTVNLMGIDHVGLGSDFNLNNTQGDLDWRRMGRWTKKMDYGAGTASTPGYRGWMEWFSTMSEYQNVVDGLRKQGLSEDEVDKIAHGNWMRMYQDVFPE